MLDVKENVKKDKSKKERNQEHKVQIKMFLFKRIHDKYQIKSCLCSAGEELNKH